MLCSKSEPPPLPHPDGDTNRQDMNTTSVMNNTQNLHMNNIHTNMHTGAQNSYYIHREDTSNGHTNMSNAHANANNTHMYVNAYVNVNNTQNTYVNSTRGNNPNVEYSTAAHGNSGSPEPAYMNADQSQVYDESGYMRPVPQPRERQYIDIIP